MASSRGARWAVLELWGTPTLHCLVHHTLITACVRGDGSTATAALWGGCHGHTSHTEHPRSRS